jgi:hypothetical protein
MKFKFSLLFTTLLVNSFLVSTTFAGPFSGIHPLQSNRFNMAVGGFFSDTEGEYSLDDPDGDDGTDVDFEDLGLDDSQVLPSLSLKWRLANRHRIQGEYFNVGQDTRETLEEFVEWGNIDFLVGASVETSMNLDVGRVFYGYSFVKDDTKEFGAGLGLHYQGLDMSLRGNGLIDGTPVLDVEEGLDDWAILPNAGIFGNYAFSPKWVLIGRADWISASIADYEGELWNVEGAIQYQAFKNVGVGLAYRYLSFDLAKDDNSGDWEANLQYSGPVLFLTANF